jgi:hypothetical protein
MVRPFTVTVLHAKLPVLEPYAQPLGTGVLMSRMTPPDIVLASAPMEGTENCARTCERSAGVLDCTFVDASPEHPASAAAAIAKQNRETMLRRD